MSKHTIHTTYSALHQLPFVLCWSSGNRVIPHNRGVRYLAQLETVEGVGCIGEGLHKIHKILEVDKRRILGEQRCFETGIRNLFAYGMQ